ncbi:type II toxin-antitoxin system HicA family toxin [Planococcus sp. APC 3900]|uniref:type II toxin-antitoxin system HicA family toxin n=1 Tax=Planococcus sp. APC 3900 TaxID=3035191 RepID=UPI0025B2C71F|nr:type II toxin-antitoxin system HicA family toxin [Planococcus sp. APC 3900]MDN3438413.1 type II toxin-antitoxin system HicA family toxin [Planococcus sp. APC 3900]
MPSFRDIERFCCRDGWEEYKKKGHHIYFMKVMEDGTIKRTKVSRGTGEVKGHLWKEILKKQLQVTEEEFNNIK